MTKQFKQVYGQPKRVITNWGIKHKHKKYNFSTFFKEWVAHVNAAFTHHTDPEGLVWCTNKLKYKWAIFEYIIGTWLPAIHKEIIAYWRPKTLQIGLRLSNHCSSKSIPTLSSLPYIIRLISGFSSQKVATWLRNVL